MIQRNYMMLLTKLLNKRSWNNNLIWQMLDMIIRDLCERDDNNLTFKVLQEIYHYAKKCNTATEFEDFLDNFHY